MNAMAALNRDTFVNEARQMELLGEIITWDLAYDTKVKYTDLLTALGNAGLETKVARALLPRFAFSRAAKNMAEQRIIRFVGEALTTGKLVFQFTKEYKDQNEDRFNYDFEATLTLEKDSGWIEVYSSVLTNEQCTELATHATELLNKAIETRTTADVTRVIKRLFEKQADLFPVREAGSVYFVPDRHTTFVDKVQKFVLELGGKVNRFPVPAGTQHGNKSVQDAVKEGLQQIINEHAQAVEEFGTDTRISTINRAFNKIEKTQFKLEAYSAYLEHERTNLDEQLALIKIQTQQKLEAVLAAKNLQE